MKRRAGRHAQRHEAEAEAAELNTESGTTDEHYRPTRTTGCAIESNRAENMVAQ